MIPSPYVDPSTFLRQYYWSVVCDNIGPRRVFLGTPDNSLFSFEALLRTMRTEYHPDSIQTSNVARLFYFTQCHVLSRRPAHKSTMR